MTVAIEMWFKGGTLDQYDQVMKLMGLDDPAAAPPDGAIFHWCAGTDEGLRVVDVWETREQFDKFAAEQIGPYTQQVGIAGPPEMTYRDVHNYLGGPPA